MARRCQARRRPDEHAHGAGVWRATSFRGSDVLHAFNRMVCTWRAPSSPHLACGLNGSFFLHSCTRPKPDKDGGCICECGVEKTCGSLHERSKCQGLSRGAQAANFRGGGWALAQVRQMLCTSADAQTISVTLTKTVTSPTQRHLDTAGSYEISGAGEGGQNGHLRRRLPRKSGQRSCSCILWSESGIAWYKSFKTIRAGPDTNIYMAMLVV